MLDVLVINEKASQVARQSHNHLVKLQSPSPIQCLEGTGPVVSLSAFGDNSPEHEPLQMIWCSSYNQHAIAYAVRNDEL